MRVHPVLVTCTAGNVVRLLRVRACSKLKSEVTAADGKITYKEGT